MMIKMSNLCMKGKNAQPWYLSTPLYLGDTESGSDPWLLKIIIQLANALVCLHSAMLWCYNVSYRSRSVMHTAAM